MMMNITRLAGQFHKWLALLIGLQVILWVSGGLVMSALPLEQVRGEHNIRPQPVRVLPPMDELIPLSTILAETRTSLMRVTLRHLDGEPVYELHGAGAPPRLVDARTGAALTPLDTGWAERLARADFAGEGEPVSIALRDETGIEYRGPHPVWQVIFDDGENTRLYISPDTGQILARRNDMWRVFDFFWMLHIMDYSERMDFNHPLLIGAAAVALIMTLSGVFLIFTRFRRRDFRWLRFWQKRGSVAKP
jgi:uncharacterized iron-regulated membrane protein